MDPLATRYSLDDFRPGGSVAAGFQAAGRYATNGSDSKLVIKNPQDGWLYFSDGSDGIVLDPDNGDLDISITLVTTGQIDFKTKENSSWTPAHDGLIAFSTYDQDRCSDGAIKLSDQGTTWDGLFYAPRGRIELPGSDGGTLNGSLVGWSILLNGQGLSIQAPAGASTGDPISKLTQ